MIRLATPEDADDVARLMIAFRNWWQRDEPGDHVFDAGVRRLLADPNTDYLLAGDRPRASAACATASPSGPARRIAASELLAPKEVSVLGRAP